MINAQTDTELNTSNGSGLYIKPIKQAIQANALHCDAVSGEISYAAATDMNNHYDAVATDYAIATALAPYSTTAETHVARLAVLNNCYDSFTTDAAIATAHAPYSTTAQTDAARLAV